MRETLSHLLRYLGVGDAPDAAHDKTPSEEQIVLFLPLGPDQRLRVGTLRKDASEFVFAYAPEFQARTDIPTLPDFPDRERVYRAPELWPFFLARLPPTNRPDVREIIEQRGIEPENTLEVLGELGKKAISSPYELELLAH